MNSYPFPGLGLLGCADEQPGNKDTKGCPVACPGKERGNLP